MNSSEVKELKLWAVECYETRNMNHASIISRAQSSEELHYIVESLNEHRALNNY